MAHSSEQLMIATLMSNIPEGSEVFVKKMIPQIMSTDAASADGIVSEMKEEGTLQNLPEALKIAVALVARTKYKHAKERMFICHLLEDLSRGAEEKSVKAKVKALKKNGNLETAISLMSCCSTSVQYGVLEEMYKHPKSFTKDAIYGAVKGYLNSDSAARKAAGRMATSSERDYLSLVKMETLSRAVCSLDEVNEGMGTVDPNVTHLKHNLNRLKAVMDVLPQSMMGTRNVNTNTERVLAMSLGNMGTGHAYPHVQ